MSFRFGYRRDWGDELDVDYSFEAETLDVITENFAQFLKGLGYNFHEIQVIIDEQENDFDEYDDYGCDSDQCDEYYQDEDEESEDKQ